MDLREQVLMAVGKDWMTLPQIMNALRGRFKVVLNEETLKIEIGCLILLGRVEVMQKNKVYLYKKKE